MNHKSAIEIVGVKGRQLRIDLGQKQEELAGNAGISLSTLKAFESGKSISVANLVKTLAQLDCLDAFEQIIPDVAPNPLDLIKLEGKTRQRVRSLWLTISQRFSTKLVVSPPFIGTPPKDAPEPKQA